MTSIGVRERLAMFRHRDFTLYLMVRSLSGIAAQMIIVAVGWQVYQLTGRVLDLGFIGLSQFLPFLCLVLFAGHAADQFDRRLILILCTLVYATCAACLLGFALGRLHQTLPIFAVLAGLGIARAFQMPAAQSFLPNLVPPEQFGAAVAINASAFQLATIAGPSVGGVLYAIAEHSSGARSGATLVYAVSLALLLIAVILLSSIKLRRKAAERTGFSWRVLLEGLNFVWHRKPVLGAISLDLFAVLFGGASALLPAFTRDVLHAGPEVFGYLRTAPGIGASATALLLAVRPISRRVGVAMFTGVGVFGAATIVLGLTQQVGVALIALVLLGAGDMVSVFVRQMLVQLETPDSIRGRVSAVNAVFIGASNELGEFESGLTAAWMGLVPAIVAGGVATLIVSLLWARFLFPMLWRMQRFDVPKEP